MLRVQVYCRWRMDVQQAWVNHKTEQRWSCKQLYSGTTFLVEAGVCSFRQFDIPV